MSRSALILIVELRQEAEGSPNEKKITARNENLSPLTPEF
jgi:hypothetical protein